MVEDASDFYSGRLTNNERKSNFAEEILANADFRKKTKQKFLELQQKKRTIQKIKHQRKKKNVTKLAKKALAESKKKKPEN